MRFVILLGCMMIAFSINDISKAPVSPELIRKLGWILLIVSMIDIYEFLLKITKK